MISNKKGITPVVATVLLIGIVVVAAIIIFLALFAFKGEACTKFYGGGSSSCSDACNDVDFTVSKSGTNIAVNNRGSVGISSLNVKDDSGDITPCPVQVSAGRSSTTSCDYPSGGGSVIPIIQGENVDGEAVDKVCSDAEQTL